jgi:hypothetical protein
VLASLLMCLLMFLGSAQGKSPVTDEFPFQFREGLIWVEVQPAHSSTLLHFILDSGAQVSVLNLRVARQLRVTDGVPAVVRGVKSGTVGYWPEYLKARLGKTALPTDYLAVNLDDLSQACHGEVDGLIGEDFFEQHVVRIDFTAREIRLSRAATAEAGDIVLPIKTGGGRLRAPVTINSGKMQWFRVDTGCASPLQWVDQGTPPPFGPRQIAVGLSQVSMPLTKTSVRLGNFEFKDVPTGLQEKRLFTAEDGLLGSGLMSRFSVVTIASSARCLILQTNSQSTFSASSHPF